MTEQITSKWNARYNYSGAPVPPPADVLSRGARWLPTMSSEDEARCALDLACGRAANAQWLANRGFIVSAWDISEVVIDAIRQRQPCLITEAIVRDVTLHPPEPASFDVIVVSRFLDRSLCPAISAALKPGGTLFYQTFTHGLSNPNYLLNPNELLSLFAELDILEYHEPPPNAAGKAEARLIARRSSRLAGTAA